MSLESSTSSNPGRPSTQRAAAKAGNGLPPADRILVVRLGAMGDVVRTLPSVAVLRSLYPGAHLAWLVEPASAGVVEASGLVDEVIVFPRGELVEALRAVDGLSFVRRLTGLLRKLRGRRFQLALDYHGLLKSGLLTWLSGAATRVGFARPIAREGASLFANQLVYGVDSESSRYARNAALLAALAQPAARETVRRQAEGPAAGGGALLSVSPLAQARLAARLRVAGRERARGFALIHPGSSAGTRHKRYAPASWAEVGRRLAEAGVQVWVATGPNRDERSLAEEIVRLGEGVLVLAPETRSIEDLIALQSRCGIFLACDSGPLHVASLVGVPVVQLLGPTHPAQNAPWSAGPVRRVRVPLPCSPCRRGCGDPACMRVLAPRTVARVALELLEAERSEVESTGGEGTNDREAGEAGA